MADKQGQEIEVRRPYETAMAEMRGRAEVDAMDTFAVAASVADKIVQADTIEGILEAADSGLAGIGDLDGKAFRFLGGSLRWSKSAEKFREGGTGVYAVFTAILKNGTELTLSTGAVNVVFQLRALEKKGVFDSEGELYPFEFTVKSRETANGTLYRLAAAE